MGMLLRRHYAENEPVPVKQPVQEKETTKDEAATAKKPGRPKKNQ